MSEKSKKERKIQEIMPSAEEVQKELAKAKSMDDFFGKEGIFARLFANTIETIYTLAESCFSETFSVPRDIGQSAHSADQESP